MNQYNRNIPLKLIYLHNVQKILIQYYYRNTPLCQSFFFSITDNIITKTHDANNLWHDILVKHARSRTTWFHSTPNFSNIVATNFPVELMSNLCHQGVIRLYLHVSTKKGRKTHGRLDSSLCFYFYRIHSKDAAASTSYLQCYTAHATQLILVAHLLSPEYMILLLHETKWRWTINPEEEKKSNNHILLPGALSAQVNREDCLSTA